MIKQKPNRRMALKGKVMRLHKVDFLDVLAEKPKINRVTKRVFFEYVRRLKKMLFFLRRYAGSSSGFRLIKKMNYQSLGKLRFFARTLPRFPAKMAERRRKKREVSATGSLLKKRKLISLYFSAGRKTKRKQLRVLNKKGAYFQTHYYIRDTSPIPSQFARGNKIERHVSYLLERRVSALLARAHFANSYQSRQWCQHGKIMLNGEIVERPDQIVRNYVPLTLMLMYKIRRKKQLTALVSRRKKKGIGFTTYPPIHYMYVDYVLFNIWCYTNTDILYASTHMYNAKKSGFFSSLSR